MKYDLSLLTDIEFQTLINKIVQKKYSDKTVQEFCEGRDGGIDGLVTLSQNTRLIIQSKHYLKTGYNGLKGHIRDKELSKIIKLNPDEYILATSVDLSAREAQELHDMIQKVVPTTRIEVWGYTTIESQLDSHIDIVKGTIKLWAKDVEIVKKILNDKSKETEFLCLERRWRKIDKYFVPFEGINKFKDILDKEHMLLISGEPGIGKTTLAEYLCKKYFIDGFRIEIIDTKNLDQRIDLTNPDDKILFYFDDFLGSNYFDGIEDSFDRHLVDLLKEIKYQNNKRFILTSRTNIIEKGCFYSQEFDEFHLKDIAIPLISVYFTDEVKAKILYSHLWHSFLDVSILSEIVSKKIYNQIIHHKNFNPRLIEFITDVRNVEKSNLDYLTFIKESLDNPEGIWGKCYTNQFNESQRTLVKIVVANGGTITEDLLKKAYNNALSIFNLSDTRHERKDYPYVFSICENSLLKRAIVDSIPFYAKGDRKKIIEISTFNPSVNDFIIPLISNEFELKKLFDALQSTECIRFIGAAKVDKKSEILSYILDKPSFDSMKVLCLRYLMQTDRDKAKNYVEKIIFQTSVSLNDIDDIIIEYINDIDFSDLIERNINSYSTDPESACQLYEAYSKSNFCNEKILALLQQSYVLQLCDYIEDILHDDDDFNSCVTELDGINRFNNILDDYKYLSNEDRNKIIEKIDMEEEIRNNQERMMEDDFRSNDDNTNFTTNSFNPDTLFSGLLER